MPITQYYAIMPSSDGQEMAAWLFLRWMMAPEQELRLAMSEGTIPANQLSREAMTKVDILPEQQRLWLSQLDEPAIIPSLPSWLERKRVLQDGFNQVIQANTTQEQITIILQSMDAFFEEIKPATP
jgi:ABC-type glycerol-3-phosphate transport system substrate-binding protein